MKGGGVLEEERGGEGRTFAETVGSKDSRPVLEREKKSRNKVEKKKTSNEKREEKRGRAGMR